MLIIVDVPYNSGSYGMRDCVLVLHFQEGSWAQQDVLPMSKMCSCFAIMRACSVTEIIRKLDVPVEMLQPHCFAAVSSELFTQRSSELMSGPLSIVFQRRQRTRRSTTIS
jgi:hypothetical protein